MKTNVKINLEVCHGMAHALFHKRQSLEQGMLLLMPRAQLELSGDLLILTVRLQGLTISSCCLPLKAWICMCV